MVESIARVRHIRVTPQKARRVVNLIRGKQALEALAILKFAPQGASEPVYKLVASAIANARVKADAENTFLDEQDLRPGMDWPEALSDCHRRSRVVLPVLAVPYFASPWCCTELDNALLRPGGPIVVPVRFNDCDDEELVKLPADKADAIARIQRADFYPFTNLVRHDQESAVGHQFREAVRLLVEDAVLPAIRRAPEFAEDFPRLPVSAWATPESSWSARLTP